MSHGAIWFLEVAMNRPEVALWPVATVLGLVVLWPRPRGPRKDRRR